LPVTSATSAHSPGCKNSSGTRVSESTACHPSHLERLSVPTHKRMAPARMVSYISASSGT
jgi:hypothetical protein